MTMVGAIAFRWRGPIGVAGTWPHLGLRHDCILTCRTCDPASSPRSAPSIDSNEAALDHATASLDARHGIGSGLEGALLPLLPT